MISVTAAPPVIKQRPQVQGSHPFKAALIALLALLISITVAVVFDSKLFVNLDATSVLLTLFITTLLTLNYLSQRGSFAFGPRQSTQTAVFWTLNLLQSLSFIYNFRNGVLWGLVPFVIVSGNGVASFFFRKFFNLSPSKSWFGYMLVVLLSVLWAYETVRILLMFASMTPLTAHSSTLLSPQNYTVPLLNWTFVSEPVYMHFCALAVVISVFSRMSKNHFGRQLVAATIVSGWYAIFIARPAASHAITEALKSLSDLDSSSRAQAAAALLGEEQRRAGGFWSFLMQ